jgi:hypothetical protein
MDERTLLALGGYLVMQWWSTCSARLGHHLAQMGRCDATHAFEVVQASLSL